MIDNRYYYRAHRISSVQYAIIKAISTLTQLNEYLGRDPITQPLIMGYIDDLAGCSDSPTLDSHADGRQQCQVLFDVASSLHKLCDDHKISSRELRDYVNGAAGTIVALWSAICDYIRIDDAVTQIDWNLVKDTMYGTFKAFSDHAVARRILWLYTIDFIVQLMPGKGNPGVDLKEKFRKYMATVPDYDYDALRATLRGMLPLTEMEFKLHPFETIIAESYSISTIMASKIAKKDGESGAEAKDQ